MCLDSREGKIYVCGGKVINRGPDIPVHSGFYAYDIASKEWDILRCIEALLHFFFPYFTDGSIIGSMMQIRTTAQ